MSKQRAGKRKIILSVVLVLLILCAAVICFLFPAPVSKDVREIRDKIAEDRHIIHAGGYIETEDGETVFYTNSREALENLYASGDRVCEIDLQRTVDGVLICAHGDEENLIFGSDLPPDASEEEFQNALLYGSLHTMTVEDLTGFMRDHRDLLVITDLKNDTIGICRELAEKYPELKEQFIVQMFLPEEYDLLAEMGFRYIMYPIFQTPDDQRDVMSLRAFVRAHEIVSLIVPNGYFSPDIKLALAQRIIGVPVVLHTINDEWEMNYYLDHHLALAIYTDRTEFRDKTQ